MKKFRLETAVLLCGAIIMVLELVAARVLSPYVGSSNIVWTSIIGIILVSMSLGYWFGGKIADKSPKLQNMSIVILGAAVLTSFIPILETIFVKTLSSISQNLVVVAIISAIIVFSIPSFLLAMISPYAIKLKAQKHEEIGKLSGRLSSLSTIGSIAGTFLAGFFLIPTFGVRAIVLGVSIILLLLSIWLFDEKNKIYLLLIVLIGIGIIGNHVIGKNLYEANNPEVIADVDSQYSRIIIKKMTKDDATTYTAMEVEKGIESYIDDKTGKMAARYCLYYDLFDYYYKDAKDTLLIGGAAYTYPTYFLEKFSEETMDVVEIDSKMTDLAREHFNLKENERLDIIHQDGRSFLNNTDRKYDAIFFDAFKGTNAPFELTTYEALANVKRCLNENGILITNMISAIEGDFAKYEYATYKKVFDDVKLFYVASDDENLRQNLIMVGFKGEPDIDTQKYEEYQDFLRTEITDYSSDKVAVTDDYCPIGS